MNPTELRIGNLLLRDGNLDEVTGIFHQFDTETKNLYFIQGKNNLDYQIEDFKPIPITEEWLIKLGFTKRNDNWFGIDFYTELLEFSEEFCLSYNLSSKRCGFYETSEKEYEQYPIFTAKLINHIHQLQNLYFELTGKELTINI